MRRKLLATLFCVAGFGGIASAAYIHSTIAQYENAAPCGKLHGVPGLLQSAHLLTQGNCSINPTSRTNACKAEGSVCSFDDPNSRGNTIKGKCTSTYPGCACVPSTPTL